METIKKTTYVKTKQDERASNKELVMRITGMTDFDYNENVFNSGVAYAIWSNEGADDDMVAEMIEDAGYWAWWKNMYAIRDKAWIRNKDLNSLSEYKKQINKIEYKYIHSIDTILGSEDAIVYEYGYSAYIGQWFKQIAKENNKIINK
jgi:nuclear transport factor 2 (NTF2) superfamily protein